ncbi:hypothetical protein BD626DRAFT_573014 [Schizophyllum amplum]|uniref:Uncharacterized protein n=1 Tax=Schizophyllum amplum TaxID=97359 RepID=A0A550C2F9_9AGAR|nr:hypothetical protein BD626DRAFT_573014 [Auriculariopsis ampla]
MVSFAICRQLARLPFFVASYLHGYQWGSVGAVPGELGLIDPERRLEDPKERSPIHEIDWFNPYRPWDGYMPCGPFARSDALYWLGGAYTATVEPVEGGVRLTRDWVAHFSELERKVSSACSDVYFAIPSLFVRQISGQHHYYRPYSLVHGKASSTFESADRARAQLGEWQAQILSNIAFLAWFTSCCGAWRDCMHATHVQFVESLALEARKVKGYLINLPVDYLWLDFDVLVDHDVPFHYIWTPAASSPARFLRAWPPLVARVLELYRVHQDALTDEIVLQDQRATEAVLDYDRWFQSRDPFALPHGLCRDSRMGRLEQGCSFSVQMQEYWLPYVVDDEAVVRRMGDDCALGFPCRSPHDEPVAVELRAYPWIPRNLPSDLRSITDRIAEGDHSVHAACFLLPEIATAQEPVLARELRRLTSAPFPQELLPTNCYAAVAFERTIEALEIQLVLESWSEAEVDAIDQPLREVWLEACTRINPFLYDSRQGAGPIPLAHRWDPQSTGSSTSDASGATLTLAQRLSSPAPEGRGGRLASLLPLSERIGARVTDEEAAQLLIAGRSSEASERRGRPGGSGSGRRSAPTRTQSERRSASPPARGSLSTRGSASLSSRGATSTEDDEYKWPEPPDITKPIISNTGDWFRAADQIKDLAQWLQGVLSPFTRPRAARARGTIAWAPEVIHDGYLVLDRPEDQLRFFFWAILMDDPRIEELLNTGVYAGVPMSIALPVGYYTVEPPATPLRKGAGHTIAMVELGEGGREVFDRWKAGLEDLARRPHIIALYLRGGLVAYILDRWAGDIVRPLIGLGPCQRTRDTFAGGVSTPGAPVPKVFYDEAHPDEINYIHGLVRTPNMSTTNKDDHHWIFPPPDVFGDPKIWPTCGEWTREEDKFLEGIAHAFEQGRWAVPTHHRWYDLVRQRGRLFRRTFNKNNVMPSSDARAWAEWMGAVFGVDPQYRRISTLANVRRPVALFHG